MTRFSDLPLDDSLQRAVADAGYETPTPIQAQAIPHLLQGRDLLGCARTGTGKTAAFALPILQRLSRDASGSGIRTLVLVPTRELASQVNESFRTYGRHLDLTSTVIYGGVSQGTQVRALQKGVDILVATPGRLVDLMNQGHVRLDRVQVLVLDEADHMLDLGFIPDVRRIIKALPAKRQTLLFSATMPPPIEDLAQALLHDPATVKVTPPATTVELVEQSVHFVGTYDKPDLLARILAQPEAESALVFTRTKRGADRVAKRLVASGIPALAIHGNKAQAVRERTLKSFREGRTRVLVATDVAARGIDVEGISHVINYELPNVPETYVHRIGRTGRAGAAGIAIALVSDDEKPLLKDIEKLTKRPVRVALLSEVPALPPGFKHVAAPSPDAGIARGQYARHEDPRRRQAPQHAKRAARQTQAPRGKDSRHAAASRPAQPRQAQPRRAEPPRHAEPRHAEPRHADSRRVRGPEPRSGGTSRPHREPAAAHAPAHAHARAHSHAPSSPAAHRASDAPRTLRGAEARAEARRKHEEHGSRPPQGSRPPADHRGGRPQGSRPQGDQRGRPAGRPQHPAPRRDERAAKRPPQGDSRSAARPARPSQPEPARRPSGHAARRPEAPRPQQARPAEPAFRRAKPGDRIASDAVARRRTRRPEDGNGDT